MSEIAIVNASDMGYSECEEFADQLRTLTEDMDTTFIVTNVDVEVMDEDELKEHLSHLVCILEKELSAS